MERDAKDPLARGLGWFSLGLGAVQVVAPRRLNRLIGVVDEGTPVTVQRLVGARELAAAAGIFGRPKPAGWLWARVAGDAMDLALLGVAAARAARRPVRIAGAAAAVAGVVVPDVLEALRLSTVNEDGTVRRAITVNKPVDDVRRAWRDHAAHVEGAVSFEPAPGARGTEIHVEVSDPGASAGPKLHDELRRFKQRVETGELVRSDASPRGETLAQHLLQRAAKPLDLVGGGSR
jgi:hypothetical protein